MPLEVFVKNDKGPIYGTTFDDDQRGGYAAALPFNAYGALGMARGEYDTDSGSSQARRYSPPCACPWCSHRVLTMYLLHCAPTLTVLLTMPYSSSGCSSTPT